MNLKMHQRALDVDPREERLTAWVRDQLALQRRHIEDLAKEIELHAKMQGAAHDRQVGAAGTEVILDPYLREVSVNPKTMVRFVLSQDPSDNYIDIRIMDGQPAERGATPPKVLHVMAGKTLNVQPHSANTLWLVPGRF